MKNDKNNYDILFIGGVYKENTELEYLKKSRRGIQNAVNVHQWNLIKAIDSNNNKPVNILSARYIDSFPNYKEIFVKKEKWSHIDSANDENIGFINIKLIKNILRKHKLILKAKRWAKEQIKNDKIIFCYYPSIPQMIASIKARKKNSKIKIILIVPDIPKFMNLNSNISKLKKIIYKYIERKQEKLINMFDGYILLTNQMANVLKIYDKPRIIIEGLVNENDEIDNKTCKLKKQKSIVYSGSLHRKYGLEEYINAIKLIKDPNIIFYIFGSGEMEEEINKISKRDKRVKFMGYKDRNEVLKFQKEATLLINPRNTNEEFVKYSFPSKIIEYMLSGTPILTTRLPCIPKEYNDYLYFIEGEGNAEEIKSAIIENLYKNVSELNIMGEKAKKFILNNKGYKKQGERIMKFLEKVK